MTLPEVLLWRILRTRPGGHKFRRQHAAGPYVLDFYCLESALCIEVDGEGHQMGTNPRRDARRDAWLAERGIETLRIPAAEVLGGIEPVAAMIEERCASRLPYPPRDFVGRGTSRRLVEGHPCHEERPSTGFAGPPPPEIRGRIREDKEHP